jgi:hypothetical protein
MTQQPDLQESDVPKDLMREAGRFMGAPSFSIKPLEILETQARPVNFGAGAFIQLTFAVVNHTPFPLVQTVGIRYTMADGNEVWVNKKDPILTFGRDEWKATVPAGATAADIQVGILPLEIVLDRVHLDLSPVPSNDD